MKVFFNSTFSKGGGYGVLSNGFIKHFRERGITLTSDNPDIGFIYGLPGVLKQFRDTFGNLPVVYYTVWESSEYDNDFIDVIKECKPDLILTASKFNQWVLSRHGLESKILHHAVDEMWKYRIRPNDGIYTFCHYNSFEWRKGYDILLRAFCDEFKETEPVRLILKSRDIDGGLWLRSASGVFDVPNVKLLIGNVERRCMAKIVVEADCGVFPVRGEGWFLPSMECAASGIPVILPKKMSMREQFIDGGYIDLDIDGYIPSTGRYRGYLIEPSYSDLRRKMRWCFEHQDEAFAMGRFASEQIVKKFSWNVIMDKLLNYLNQLLQCT